MVLCFGSDEVKSHRTSQDASARDSREKSPPKLLPMKAKPTTNISCMRDVTNLQFHIMLKHESALSNCMQIGRTNQKLVDIAKNNTFCIYFKADSHSYLTLYRF